MNHPEAPTTRARDRWFVDSEESEFGNIPHAWRRKMGAVTLVMACVIIGGCVRSLFYANFHFCKVNNHKIQLLVSSDSSPNAGNLRFPILGE